MFQNLQITITNIYDKLGNETAILLALSIMLLMGFLITRLTKLLKLPNVSAYIIAGILIGPNVLHLVPNNIINGMSFVSDIALAFIAFGVGKFFKKAVIKETGKKVIVITLFESLLAGVLVTISMHFIFKLAWNFSLILGAIATATAPASTTMTIKQYHARGNFVNTLLQVVALDDVVCLLVYSVVISVVSASADKPMLTQIFIPILYNVLLIGLGFVLGLILSKILGPKRSKDNRLIIITAMLLGLSGICGILNISPLLSCMIFGATYINLTADKELYRQLDNFTPPIMSLFFILSGMNLDLTALKTAGLIGLGYFLIRIIGKYFGTYLGCVTTKSSREEKRYLGLAMIPQAGVSIGLAFLAQRMLPLEMGVLLLTIILSSSVIYELVGPTCAKLALFKAGTIQGEKIMDKVDPAIGENNRHIIKT